MSRPLPGSPAARGTGLLLTATAIDATGNGLYYAGAALFFTRVQGMSPTHLGLGLTLGGLFGLLAVLWLGRLADRTSPRRLLVTLKLAQGLAAAALVEATWLPAFVVLVMVLVAGDRGSSAVRGTLVAAVSGSRRVLMMGKLRVANNAGVAAGTGLAGLGLAADTRAAYTFLLLADALTFLASAVLLTRLPEVAPPPGNASSARRALHDGRFLRFTAANAVLSLQFSVITLIVPLWVARQPMPTWTASPLLVWNTLLCVALQIPMSRRSGTIAGARRTYRRAAMTLACAALVAAAATGGPASTVLPLAILFVTLHTLGELWHVAAGWGLAYGLAHPDAQGEYQGVYYVGIGSAGVLAPLLLTWLCLQLGPWGWCALSAGFATVGLALPAWLREGSRCVAGEACPT
jgi:MFS family permease